MREREDSVEVVRFLWFIIVGFIEFFRTRFFLVVYRIDHGRPATNLPVVVNRLDGFSMNVDYLKRRIFLNVCLSSHRHVSITLRGSTARHM